MAYPNFTNLFEMTQHQSSNYYTPVDSAAFSRSNASPSNMSLANSNSNNAYSSLRRNGTQNLSQNLSQDMASLVPNPIARVSSCDPAVSDSAIRRTVLCSNVKCWKKFLTPNQAFKVDSSLFCDVICYCEQVRKSSNVVICIQCRSLFAVPCSDLEVKHHFSFLICTTHCLNQFTSRYDSFCVVCGQFFQQSRSSCQTVSYSIMNNTTTTSSDSTVAQFCSIDCQINFTSKNCCICGNTQNFLDLVKFPDGRLKYCCRGSSGMNSCLEGFAYGISNGCGYCSVQHREIKNLLKMEFVEREVLVFCNSNCFREFIATRKQSAAASQASPQLLQSCSVYDSRPNMTKYSLADTLSYSNLGNATPSTRVISIQRVLSGEMSNLMLGGPISSMSSQQVHSNVSLEKNASWDKTKARDGLVDSQASNGNINIAQSKLAAMEPTIIEIDDDDSLVTVPSGTQLCQVGGKESEVAISNLNNICSTYVPPVSYSVTPTQSNSDKNNQLVGTNSEIDDDDDIQLVAVVNELSSTPQNLPQNVSTHMQPPQNVQPVSSTEVSSSSKSHQQAVLPTTAEASTSNQSIHHDAVPRSEKLLDDSRSICNSESAKVCHSEPSKSETFQIAKASNAEPAEDPAVVTQPTVADKTLAAVDHESSSCLFQSPHLSTPKHSNTFGRRVICDCCGATINAQSHPAFTVLNVRSNNTRNEDSTNQKKSFIFCSYSCKKTYQERRGLTRVCVGCNLKKPVEEEIFITRGRSVNNRSLPFCSTLCMHMYKEMHFKACGIVLCYCSFCGKDFRKHPETTQVSSRNNFVSTALSNQQNFCSEECQISFKKWNLRNRCDMCFKKLEPDSSSSGRSIKIFWNGHPNLLCNRECLLSFYEHSNMCVFYPCQDDEKKLQCERNTNSVARGESSKFIMQTLCNSNNVAGDKLSDGKEQRVGSSRGGVSVKTRTVGIQCRTLTVNSSSNTTEEASLQCEMSHKETKDNSTSTSLDETTNDKDIVPCTSTTKATEDKERKVYVPIFIPPMFVVVPVPVPFDFSTIPSQTHNSLLPANVTEKEPSSSTAIENLVKDENKSDCTEHQANPAILPASNAPAVDECEKSAQSSSKPALTDKGPSFSTVNDTLVKDENKSYCSENHAIDEQNKCHHGSILLPASNPLAVDKYREGKNRVLFDRLDDEKGPSTNNQLLVTSVGPIKSENCDVEIPCSSNNVISESPTDICKTWNEMTVVDFKFDDDLLYLIEHKQLPLSSPVRSKMEAIKCGFDMEKLLQLVKIVCKKVDDNSSQSKSGIELIKKQKPHTHNQCRRSKKPFEKYETIKFKKRKEKKKYTGIKNLNRRPIFSCAQDVVNEYVKTAASSARKTLYETSKVRLGDAVEKETIDVANLLLSSKDKSLTEVLGSRSKSLSKKINDLMSMDTPRDMASNTKRKRKLSVDSDSDDESLHSLCSQLLNKVGGKKRSSSCNENTSCYSASESASVVSSKSGALNTVAISNSRCSGIPSSTQSENGGSCGCGGSESDETNISLATMQKQSSNRMTKKRHKSKESRKKASQQKFANQNEMEESDDVFDKTDAGGEKPEDEPSLPSDFDTVCNCLVYALSYFFKLHEKIINRNGSTILSFNLAEQRQTKENKNSKRPVDVAAKLANLSDSELNTLFCSLFQELFDSHLSTRSSTDLFFTRFRLRFYAVVIVQFCLSYSKRCHRNFFLHHAFTGFQSNLVLVMKQLPFYLWQSFTSSSPKLALPRIYELIWASSVLGTTDPKTLQCSLFYHIMRDFEFLELWQHKSLTLHHFKDFEFIDSTQYNRLTNGVKTSMKNLLPRFTGERGVVRFQNWGSLKFEHSAKMMFLCANPNPSIVCCSNYDRIWPRSDYTPLNCCSVRTYLLYRKKMPPHSSQHSSSVSLLYKEPHEHVSSYSQHWYSNERLSESTLNLYLLLTTVLLHETFDYNLN